MPAVGLLVYPLGEDYGLATAPHRSLRRGYRRALLERSNPRSPDYMRGLFQDRFPDGRVVESAAEAIGDVVLLYPDAIGLGWDRTERELGSARNIRVLNGRGREFSLDRRTRRALKVRRLLERSFVVEAALLTVGALATPFLVAADAVRGRR
jgi:hypothetical protein